MFKKKVINIDNRIAHSNGPEAKKQMAEAVKRCRMSFPGIKFSVEQVGKEFWTCAEDGTSSDDLVRIKQSIRAWYERQGFEFSDSYQGEDGHAYLILPESLQAPLTPPADLKSPFIIIVAIFENESDKRMDREPKSIFHRDCSDWATVMQAIAQLRPDLEANIKTVGIQIHSKSKDN